MTSTSAELSLKPAAPRKSILSKAHHAVAKLRGWPKGRSSRAAISPASLGSDHLGRYAHEGQMPSWLKRQLAKRGQVSRDGMIGTLSLLLDENESTLYAYLCDPSVQRVTKLKREVLGGFCGYRNIQMLCSYAITQQKGSSIFGNCLPTIFQIQDLIEDAWDKGYNPSGRIETGGIKGTRKYIGTPEAKALFNSLNIPCSVQIFRSSERNTAVLQAANAIETYFKAQPSLRCNTGLKTTVTRLPPVYFQRPGHSMTVVGFEKTIHGETNILVFDPSRLYTDYDEKTFRTLAGRVKKETLRPYRLQGESLLKHSELELLYIYSS